MNQGERVLQVRDVSVALTGKAILSKISFAVSPGEFIAIVGPNGAGKSTLLRTLRRFYKMQAGEILLFDSALESLSEKKLAASIAYMQQELHLGFGFTVKQIVLTGRYPYLAWWQNEGKQDHEIAEKYMEFMGVRQFSDQPMQSLSGGERQRVLFAKALAQETPLIFLDEPTANLDLLYQEELFHYCQRLCQQGKTILLVAHDLKLAAKYCSRMLLMEKGEIIADGVPETVINAHNLEATYGIHSAVFKNKITGHLDIHTYAAPTKRNKKTVHVIGGGGAAAEIIRALYEAGFSISSGVLHEGDTDAEVSQAFHIDCLTIPPFSPIDSEMAEQNKQKVLAADVVILADICIGKQNLENLKACFWAQALLIVNDTPMEEKDYSGGEGKLLFDKLCARSTTLLYHKEELIASIRGKEINHF